MATRARNLNKTYLYGAIALGAALFALLWLVLKWNWYLCWLIGWSVATFLVYGIDKAQAGRHGWRVPENLLHGLALVGGAVGGWLGMFGFRHKTQKPVFKVVLAAATVLQAVLFYLIVL